VAGIINTVKIKFTEEGADQAASATENVNKAQTRLGNTSAANGRQFAAQSQGLGGLVAAYAGAAATSFALQQAFSALQKAAQFDQIIQGTNTFSSQFGQSASSVIGDIKRITQGQLSIVEAATSANIALSAGFNTKQLNDLADVATKASRALGRDLQDSFQRLVRGSAKLEAELLDELGIFTRIEPAVEKYAAKIGKSTTALSEFERRQAFVNAVITEGQSKFSIIDSSTSTAAQSFSRLAATLTDVALSIGNVLANSLAPLADYLNNNVAASFGAFGVILGLVLGKLNEVSSVGLQNLTKRITEASNSVSNGFLGSGAAASKKALSELSDGVQEYSNKLGQGLGPQRALRNELIDLAKAGTISVNQTRQLNGILVEQIGRETASIAALEAKKKAVGTTTLQIAAYDAELKKLNASLAQNVTAQTASAAAIAAQGRAAAVASFITSIFGKAVGFIGSFITRALSFVNILLLISSVAGLLGPKFLEIFGLEGVFNNGLQILTQIAEKFLGLDPVSKQFQSGIKGVASSLTDAAFQAGNVKANLEGVIKDSKFGFDFTIKINSETIQRDITEAISNGFKSAEFAQKEFEASFDRANVGVAVGSRLARGRTTQGLEALQQEAAALAALNTEEGKRTTATEAYNAVIQTTINDLEKKRAAGQDYNTQKLLDVQIKALREVLNLGKEQVQIGGLVADITGISAKKAYELVKVNKDGVGTLKTINSDLEVQFYTQSQIAKLDDKRRPAAKELNDIQAKLVGYSNGLLSASEKLARGQLDLNNIGKIRSDLLANEEALQTQIQELIKKGAEVDPKILAGKQEQLAVLREQRLELNKQASGQESVLRIQDSIRKTFSSQISALSNISGLVNSNGTIATDDLEITRNKLDILEKTIQAGDIVLRQAERTLVEGETLEATLGDVETRIVETAATTKQALAGSILEVLKKSVELTKEYEKQTIELKKQTLSGNISLQREQLQLQQQISDKQREYNLLITQNELNSIQRTQRSNDLANERIDILRKGREDEAKAQMSGVLGPLFTDKAKREIEIKFKEEELNDLKNALAQQQVNAKQVLAKEVELANETARRETDRIATQEKLNVLDATQKAAEIAFRIEDTKRQQEQFVKQSQSIQEQIAAFINHPRELGKVLTQFIVDFAELQKQVNPEAAAGLTTTVKGIQQREAEATQGVADQLKQVQDKLTSGVESLSLAYKNLFVVLEQQKGSVEKTAEGQQKLLNLEKQIRDARQTEAVAAATAKYNAVLAETGNKLLAAQQSLDILKREAERAGDSFTIVAVKTAESIGSNLEKGVNSLVDAVANGTLTLENFQQGFKQFILSILTDISKAILNELITKPLKESVMNFTRDLIGGLSGSGVADIGKKLAESVGPAVSGQLTQSFADLPKAIAGFKDIGVTPVFIVGASPGALSGLGGLGGAGGIGSALTGGAGGAGNVAVPGSTEAILATIRKTESGSYAGNYLAQNASSSASGAYQYIDSTWRAQATKAGVDIGQYPRAFMAPPGVQDMVARQNVEGITQQYGAGAVPNVWYTGRASGIGNPAVSPEQLSAYQQKWNANAQGMQAPLPPPRPADLDTSVKDKLDGVGESAEKFGTNLDKSGEGLVELGQKATESGAGADALARANEGGAAAAQARAAADQTGTVAAEAGAAASGADAAASATNAAAKGTEAAASATVTAAKQTEAAASQAGGGIGGMISNLFSGIGNIFGSIFSGIGSGIGSLFSGIFSIFGFSSGGTVSTNGALMHLARGGMIPNYGAMQHLASGGLRMRDSVPALLEPGEFVMKKSSVDSIGRSSMERMNATGKSSGATNIKVQVDNSGQPKEAQQGETQFDGETAIVKLILKDLNSNGPIRRSIRGNT
jgi:hypothetical protein